MKIKEMLATFYLGLRVAISELGLSLLQKLKQQELKGLLKRKEQELTILGELVSKFKNLDHPEIQLSLNQIEFLEQEINFLQKEHQTQLERLRKKRKEKLLPLVTKFV